MLKKTLSIILSIVMMLSMVSTSVLAALPTGTLAVDADSAVTTEGRWLDDFSQYTEENTTTFNNYPNSSLSQTSEVFADKQWATMYQIVDADPSENAANMALKILPLNQSSNLKPKSFTMTEGQKLRYSFDICLKDMAAETTETSIDGIMNLGPAGSGYTRFVVKANVSDGKVSYKLEYAWGDKCTIEQNKWYRIVYDLSSDMKTMSAYFTDASTGEVYFSVNDYTHSSAISLGTYNGVAAFTKVGGYLLIDNTELLVYSPAKFSPSVTDKSIADTGVATDVGTIDITFDQPITTMPSSVSLTADGKDALTATVKKATNKLNTYTLTLPVMEGGTAYTADLSGFKNAGGATANSLNFTTAAAAPVVVSSTPANGETDVLADIGSATVTFDQAMTTYPDTLTLEGGITATVTPDNDKKVFTISWSGELAEDTTYSISLAGFKNAEGKASNTEAVSFKTKFMGIKTQTDNFEDGTKIPAKTYGESYGSTDTLLYMASNSDWGIRHEAERRGLELVSVGENDNALSLLTGASTTNYAYFNPLVTGTSYKAPEGGSLVATWSFNLNKAGDIGDGLGGTYIGIGRQNSQGLTWGNTLTHIRTLDGKQIVGYDSDGYANYAEISTNKWYDVTYVISGATDTIYVTDTDTGKVIYTKSRTGSTNWSETGVYITPVSAGRTVKTVDSVRTVWGQNQEIWINDFTLWTIDPSVDKQKLKLVSSDESDDIGLTDSIKLTFNQPVIGASTMYELYKGNDKNEIAYSSVDVKNIDFCTQEVSFSNLRYMTDYTLDYSGVNAVSGADLGEDIAAATLSFGTMADPNKISIIGDITCTGLNIDDTVSFELYSKESGNAKVIAAFYERSFPEKLAGAEMADVTVAAGANTEVELTLTKAQTADYIRIFVWNGLDELVPMSRVYELHAPTDTLDVLMIGNSLSEDAGRYFNDMAEADGLNLDLTVKGVGGASLSHHAANLKAELAGRTAEEAQAEMDAGTVERALYFTYKNGEYQTATDENKLLITALREKQYDVISLQQFSAYTESAFEDSLPYLAAEIRKLQPNAEIVLYQTWSPKDSTKETRNYYFTNTIEPAIVKWAAYTGANVENITVNGEPMKVIAAGKAFYLADNKYSWCETAYTQGEGNTDAEAQTGIEAKMNGSPGLWRDYNHASYYGCYLADAVWYGTITGKKAPVGTEANPVVKAPSGVTAAEHIERLTELSNIAHQVVMEQSN